MTFARPVNSSIPVRLQRALGELRVSTKATVRGSGLDTLYQKGSYKMVFPRAQSLTGVIVNTSGGVTGGDNFDLAARVGEASDLTLTTQAAERAYKALPGQSGTVRSRLEVGPGASLRWLPQETIVFDGADFDRHLRCDLAPDASVLIVEPIIFGRAAMGEDCVHGRVSDRVELWQNGRLIHLDAWRLEGDLTEALSRPSVAGGASAMVSLVYAGARAEVDLEPLRSLMPETGGASLKSDNLLVARLVAKDGYHLRKSLLPILDYLTQHTLPTCWRL